MGDTGNLGKPAVPEFRRLAQISRANQGKPPASTGELKAEVIDEQTFLDNARVTNGSKEALRKLFEQYAGADAKLSADEYDAMLASVEVPSLAGKVKALLTPSAAVASGRAALDAAHKKTGAEATGAEKTVASVEERLKAGQKLLEQLEKHPESFKEGSQAVTEALSTLKDLIKVSNEKGKEGPAHDMLAKMSKVTKLPQTLAAPVELVAGLVSGRDKDGRPLEPEEYAKKILEVPEKLGGTHKELLEVGEALEGVGQKLHMGKAVEATKRVYGALAGTVEKHGTQAAKVAREGIDKLLTKAGIQGGGEATLAKVMGVAAPILEKANVAADAVGITYAMFDYAATNIYGESHDALTRGLGGDALGGAPKVVLAKAGQLVSKLDAAYDELQRTSLKGLTPTAAQWATANQAATPVLKMAHDLANPKSDALFAGEFSNELRTAMGQAVVRANKGSTNGPLILAYNAMLHGYPVAADQQMALAKAIGPVMKQQVKGFAIGGGMGAVGVSADELTADDVGKLSGLEIQRYIAAGSPQQLAQLPVATQHAMVDKLSSSFATTVQMAGGLSSDQSNKLLGKLLGSVVAGAPPDQQAATLKRFADQLPWVERNKVALAAVDGLAPDQLHALAPAVRQELAREVGDSFKTDGTDAKAIGKLVASLDRDGASVPGAAAAATAIMGTLSPKNRTIVAGVAVAALEPAELAKVTPARFQELVKDLGNGGGAERDNLAKLGAAMGGNRTALRAVLAAAPPAERAKLATSLVNLLPFKDLQALAPGAGQDLLATLGGPSAPGAAGEQAKRLQPYAK